MEGSTSDCPFAVRNMKTWNPMVGVGSKSTLESLAAIWAGPLVFSRPHVGRLLGSGPRQAAVLLPGSPNVSSTEYLSSPPLVTASDQLSSIASRPHDPSLPLVFLPSHTPSTDVGPLIEHLWFSSDNNKHDSSGPRQPGLRAGNMCLRVRISMSAGVKINRYF